MIWILNVFFILLLFEVSSVIWTWYWIITTSTVSFYLVKKFSKKISKFYNF